jgi:hypothetical protein
VQTKTHTPGELAKKVLRSTGYVQLLTPIKPNSSVNQKFFWEIFRQRWEQHGLEFAAPDQLAFRNF